MDVVVIGAGIAGLGTSLHLAEAGHRVTLLERDRPPPEDPEALWATWDRRGVPQSRLAHVFLGAMRNALRDEHPELYAGLLAAGATEIRWADYLPPAIEDRSPRAVDDDIVMLGMRRPVLELHLRRAVADAGATIESSTAVVDLVTGKPARPGTPHVTGVALEDGTTRSADLVVDCSGRRSPLPQWLVRLGAPAPPEDVTEDGLTYYGRYYRVPDGAPFPEHPGPLVDIGYLFALTFEGDAGYFAIALGVHNEDAEMRRLRDPDVFEAALRAIPHTAPWREPGVAEPVAEVKTMSRIDDRWRDFVVDGAPLVTGLVPLGDSVIATNPAFGRGSSLAWMAARALPGVLDDHPGDPVGLALAYDGMLRTVVRPWYEQTAQLDAGRVDTMRRVLAGLPPADIDPDDVAAVFGLGIQLASRTDAEVYRAFAQVAHLLVDPLIALADPHVAAKAIEAFEGRAGFPPPDGPTRAELLAAMDAARSEPTG